MRAVLVVKERKVAVVVPLLDLIRCVVGKLSLGRRIFGEILIDENGIFICGIIYEIRNSVVRAYVDGKIAERQSKLFPAVARANGRPVTDVLCKRIIGFIIFPAVPYITRHVVYHLRHIYVVAVVTRGITVGVFDRSGRRVEQFYEIAVRRLPVNFADFEFGKRLKSRNAPRKHVERLKSCRRSLSVLTRTVGKRKNVPFRRVFIEIHTVSLIGIRTVETSAQYDRRLRRVRFRTRRLNMVGMLSAAPREPSLIRVENKRTSSQRSGACRIASRGTPFRSVRFRHNPQFCERFIRRRGFIERNAVRDPAVVRRCCRIRFRPRKLCRDITVRSVHRNSVLRFLVRQIKVVRSRCRFRVCRLRRCYRADGESCYRRKHGDERDF